MTPLGCDVPVMPDGGSATYVSAPPMISIFPVGSPECCTPVQQSAVGGFVSVFESCDIVVELIVLRCVDMVRLESTHYLYSSSLESSVRRQRSKESSEPRITFVERHVTQNQAICSPGPRWETLQIRSAAADHQTLRPAALTVSHAPHQISASILRSLQVVCCTPIILHP